MWITSIELTFFLFDVVNYAENRNFAFELICFVSFLIDMIISLNCAFYERGILVTNR